MFQQFWHWCLKCCQKYHSFTIMMNMQTGCMSVVYSMEILLHLLKNVIENSFSNSVYWNKRFSTLRLNDALLSTHCVCECHYHEDKVGICSSIGRPTSFCCIADKSLLNHLSTAHQFHMCNMNSTFNQARWHVTGILPSSGRWYMYNHISS